MTVSLLCAAIGCGASGERAAEQRGDDEVAPAPEKPSIDVRDLPFEPGALTISIDGRERRLTIGEREATIQNLGAAQSISMIARGEGKEGLVLSFGGFLLDLQVYPLELDTTLGSARLRYVDPDGKVFTAANNRTNAPLTLYLVDWNAEGQTLRGAFSGALLTGDGAQSKVIDGAHFEAPLIQPLNLR
ncbi:MAG: hypothetical protein H6710_11625 [Myxococcales bacterium]|nr:hypothetical protein [Myxococcales bacterium]MCB9700283.1 hypothetical protein [Myxococcales bacterium]